MQLLLLSASLLFGLAVARPPSLGSGPGPWPQGKVYTAWELAQFDLAPFNLTHMRIGCSKDNGSILFGCSIKCE